MSFKNIIISVLLLFVCLIICTIFSIMSGYVDYSLKELIYRLFLDELSLRREILINIRLPRALAAAVVGGTLSVCGVVTQAVARNPMADPYLMGVSSGASLGAMICLLIFGGSIGSFGLSSSAFLGALLSSSMILAMSLKAKATVYHMILIGLAINALCSSLGSLLIYLSDDANLLRTLVFWLMGSLAPASWGNLFWVFLASFTGLIFFIINSRNINLVNLSDDEAISLGLSPRNFRLLCLVFIALMTASSVAYFGMIGFVGIIVPHILRFIIGGNHIALVPLSFFSGGCFLVLVDLLARSIGASEIPLGVITGLLGSPFFFWLLLGKWRAGH
jgi:iron complex transport system permease protein